MGVEIWDVQAGKCLGRLGGHDHWINSLVFDAAPGTGLLASSSQDQTMKTWDIQSKSCVATLKLTKPTSKLAFIDAGLLASDDGVIESDIKIWDLRTGECETTLVGGGCKP